MSSEVIQPGPRPTELVMDIAITEEQLVRMNDTAVFAYCAGNWDGLYGDRYVPIPQTAEVHTFHNHQTCTYTLRFYVKAWANEVAPVDLKAKPWGAQRWGITDGS